MVHAERPVDLDALATSDAPGARALLQRATNLGVLGWPIWAGERGGSVLAALADPDVRMVVADLGSVGSREQQAVVAAGVLGEVYQRLLPAGSSPSASEASVKVSANCSRPR